MGKTDKDGLQNEIMKGHEEFGGDWFFFLTVVMILWVHIYVKSDQFI